MSKPPKFVVQKDSSISTSFTCVLRRKYAKPLKGKTHGPVIAAFRNETTARNVANAMMDGLVREW